MGFRPRQRKEMFWLGIGGQWQGYGDAGEIPPRREGCLGGDLMLGASGKFWNEKHGLVRDRAGAFG
ncbi:MAG TPA: hypothetical protein DIC50_07610 [Verrucomicrobia subdivision 3 bacterium]|nr:hypothetical protein [Limisphaerales bacterium]